jgi:hypothetical protein
VFESRLKYFDKLSSFEKDLVQNPFPVLIKVKNSVIEGKPKQHVRSDVKELAITEAITIEELSYIYVPAEKIAITKAYLSEK